MLKQYKFTIRYTSKKKRQNKRIKQTKRLYKKQKHDELQHFQNKRRQIVIN